jgi:asparagine synthase (glutamine-hydrolysing)
MSGTLLDFLIYVGPDEQGPRPGLLDDVANWPRRALDNGPVHGRRLAAGVQLWWRGEPLIRPVPRGGWVAALEPDRARGDARQVPAARAALDGWCSHGHVDAAALQGRFAFLAWDAPAHRLLALTDAFRTCPMVWSESGGGVWLASDVRLITRARAQAVQVCRQALYQYLNFSYVPAPLTAVEGIHKVPAGWRWSLEGGRVEAQPWWDATYPADLQAGEDERVRELRSQIVQTVQDYRHAGADGWGAFLSGGTDSSSICGILAGAHSAPVRSFSIGFGEEGYDELAYARVASQAFGLHASEARVLEPDAVAAVPDLVEAFDEPFGNASAIPTLACARLAASQGVTHLVAGDGGDEIFGGNERYRKDAIFEMFHGAPAPVRLLGRAAAAGLGGVEARWANRIKNFVRRGSLPNPDRFYADDAFASVHFEQLLTPSFRSGLAVDDALNVQRRLHDQAQTDHALHRLMYLDLKMTIADNDVAKVVRTTRLAGVEVCFPFLDRRLVDFTGRLPAHDKLRGKHKRYLFKRAMDDILPEAIRKKRKQGFGLPISVWLRGDGPYRELVEDTVFSSRALHRDIFETGFVRGLLARHRQNAWDHAADLHQLLMLELWHRAAVDGRA